MSRGSIERQLGGGFSIGLRREEGEMGLKTVVTQKGSNAIPLFSKTFSILSAVVWLALRIMMEILVLQHQGLSIITYMDSCKQ